MQTTGRPIGRNFIQDVHARGLLASSHSNRIQDVDDPARRVSAQLYGSFVEVRFTHGAAPSEAAIRCTSGLLPIAFFSYRVMAELAMRRFGQLGRCGHAE